MPLLTIPASPLRPGIRPVSIQYRERGTGVPLVLLHGGWGNGIYPFDRAIAALSDRFHVFAPDRSGYGGSGPIDHLDADFHEQAAAETFAVLDALGLDRVCLWGHSDGAVIGARMALQQPERFAGLVLEALHLYGVKPASRPFFAGLAEHPEGLDPRVATVLAAEHGEAYWPTLIRLHGRAWLALADRSPSPDADLYGGRLGALRVPVLILHGRQDPRTEPGELDALRRALPGATFAVLEDGGHCPHSERAVAEAATVVAAAFLDRCVEVAHVRR
ncbi:MAG: alpha/beta fold hydrolase [Acidobacteriota bacterium]|nr:alpha/beta fold hydrolase [Acidobacteriota bacterium]